MGKFAVIDTESNWADQVMSIGTVIADADTFESIEAKYHILPIEYEIGGMYYDTLFIETPVKPIICTRSEAIADLRVWFQQYGVQSIFAYNAGLTEIIYQSYRIWTGTILCALPPIASTTLRFPLMLIAVPPGV